MNSIIKISSKISDISIKKCHVEYLVTFILVKIVVLLATKMEIE